MPITANVVAVVAILAGIVGIWLTNRNQRTLVRDQYQRDHVTKTYLMLLEAVHVRELQVNDADQLPLGQPSSVTPPADVASYEANFRAMLLAFSSPAIFDKLWPAFDTRTIQLIDLMNRLRQQHQKPTGQIPGVKEIPEFKEANANWMKARSDLVNTVRAELEFRESTATTPSFLHSGP